MAEGPVDPTNDPTRRALQDEVEEVEEIEDSSPLEHETSSDLSEEHFRHAKALCRGIKKVVMAANLYEPDHGLMEGFFLELHVPRNGSRSFRAAGPWRRSDAHRA